MYPHSLSEASADLTKAAGRELLGSFTGRHGGFQALRESSYRKHAEWRQTVFQELLRLEGEGLLVIRQLIPCNRHGRCCGQPVAAGCELTREGRRMRDEALAAHLQ